MQRSSMHVHAHGVVQHTRSAAFRDVADVGYVRWRDTGSWILGITRSGDVGSERHEIQRGPRSRDPGSGDSESVGCGMRYRTPRPAVQHRVRSMGPCMHGHVRRWRCVARRYVDDEILQIQGSRIHEISVSGIMTRETSRG